MGRGNCFEGAVTGGGGDGEVLLFVDVWWQYGRKV